MKLSLSILLGREELNFKNLLLSSFYKLKLFHQIILILDLEYSKLTKLSIYKLLNDMQINSSNFLVIEYIGSIKQPEMRNLALNNFTGDFLWFVDDDVTFFPSTIDNAINFLSTLFDNNLDLVIAGKIIESAPASKLKTPIYVDIFKGFVGSFNWEYNPSYHNYSTILINGFKYPIVPFCQGTNMIFSKKAIQKLVQFNLLLYSGYAVFEDSEPSIRLLKYNIKTIYNSKIPVFHHVKKRVGNSTRSISDNIYVNQIIKNYTITLLYNNFPSRGKAYFFLIFFVLMLTPRIFLYRIRNRLKLDLFKLLFAFFFNLINLMNSIGFVNSLKKQL